MRKRGLFNLLLVAVLSVTTGLLYSCKDYDDEMYEDLHGQIVDQNSKLTDIIEIQKQELKNLQAKMDSAMKSCKEDRDTMRVNLNEYMKQTDANIDTLQKHAARLADAEARISALEKNMDKVLEVLNGHVENSIKDLVERVTALELAKTEIINNLNALDVKITNIQGDVNNIENNINVMSNQLTQMSDSLFNVYGKVNANEAKIHAMDSILNEVKDNVNPVVSKRVDSLANVTANIMAEVDATKKIAEDNLAKAKDYAEKIVAEAAAKATEEIKKVDGRVDALTVRLSDMESAYKAADAKLQNQINSLMAEISVLEGRVSANEKAIESLDKKFENVMKKRISSVVLQGAYSPVVGYFALPTGVKSNILASYYGYPENATRNIEFPTVRTANYAFAGQEFTEREAELLGFTSQKWEDGACLIAGEGNAGTLYMTVNPSSVYLDDTQFKLVNSEGEDACAMLSKPVKSDHRLSFGYTRAGKNNGFYEVKATVDSAHVQQAKLRLDLNEIKGAVKDVLTPDDGVDMSKVISTLYTQINDVADANALEATWTDSLGEHSVYSDYGLAAVAVKPLSYTFMKDFHRDQFWGIDKAYDLLDKIMGKFNGLIPELPHFDLNIPKIDTIKLDTLTEDLLGKFEIVIDTVFTYDFELDTTFIINKSIAIDSVKVPDMTVPIEGQDIKVPIDITVPSKDIQIWNPAKPEKGKDGWDDPIYENLEDSITITVPETRVQKDVTVHVDGTNVKVEGPKVKIEDVEVNLEFPLSIKKKISIPFKFEMDMREAVEDLYGNVIGSVGSVNDMLKDLKKFIDTDLQNLLDQLNGISGDLQGNMDEALGNIKGEISNFIDKINTKLCNLVNSVNSRIQPVLLIKNAKGFGVLSSAKNYPSDVTSSFVLAPTSYTIDIVAPSFKKFVAVTDVIKGDKSAKEGNNAECVDILKATNANNVNLNKVIPGSEPGIKVENLKKGYIYEFTYSALDYYGYIVNTKYYVRVI